MYHITLVNVKLLIVIVLLDSTHCKIEGIFKARQHNATKLGTDPCNPLYWYPRNIPAYCYYKNVITPNEPKQLEAIPMPIPVPLPAPVPPPIIPYPLPFGVPLAPTNPMLPVALPPPMYATFISPLPPASSLQPIPPPQSPFAGYLPPYRIQRRLSMVPGVPGLVSPDGGINILPFSDAYSNLLERHKQKMIRKRLQRLLDEYDRYPRRRSHRNTRRMITRRVNNDVKEQENMIKQISHEENSMNSVPQEEIWTNSVPQEENWMESVPYEENRIPMKREENQLSPILGRYPTAETENTYRQDQGSNVLADMDQMFQKYDFLRNTVLK